MVRTLNIDAGVAAEASGNPIPEGWYEDVLIEDVTEKPSGPTSKNPGQPVYHVRLRINDEGEAKGRVLFFYASFHPADNPVSLIQLIGATGHPVASPLAVPDPPEFIGQTVRVNVKHETYNGEVRARADRIKAQGGGTKPAVGRTSGRVKLGAR